VITDPRTADRPPLRPAVRPDTSIHDHHIDDALPPERRRAVVVERGGTWVRFTIEVDRAALDAAGGTIAKPGWRRTLTRFRVATRSPSGTTWRALKRGHITISLGRLASGSQPRMAGLL
jgi:hypothetical protein